MGGIQLKSSQFLLYKPVDISYHIFNPQYGRINAKMIGFSNSPDFITEIIVISSPFLIHLFNLFKGFFDGKMLITDNPTYTVLRIGSNKNVDTSRMVT